MSFTGSFTEEVENLFFEAPKELPWVPTTYGDAPTTFGSARTVYGVLYLLRRDIGNCMGVPALFPATMAVLAGVDLLAKFYEGSDEGNVGRRFKRFAEKYLQPIGTDEAEQLYHLRNAMMHSFGLYSAVKDKQGNIKAEYHFIVQAGRSGTGKLVESCSNGHCFIGIQTLHDRFEDAVTSYRNDLKQTPLLQVNFMKMWHHYGYVVTDSRFSND